MIADDRAEIQQVRVLDKDRLLVVSSAATPNGPPQMKIHRLSKLDLKTGSELTESRKKQYQDVKKQQQMAQDQEQDEHDQDIDTKITFKGYGDTNIIQSSYSSSCQDQSQGQSQSSHTAISFDSHDLKLNVWDTAAAVKTKCFYFGFEPLMMAFVDGRAEAEVKAEQSQRLLVLNGKKSCFFLLDLVEGRVLWQTSERFITRHLVRGCNDQCVVVKATNEFVVMDERNNLKIFSIKTGKKKDIRAFSMTRYF